MLAGDIAGAMQVIVTNGGLLPYLLLSSNKAEYCKIIFDSRVQMKALSRLDEVLVARELYQFTFIFVLSILKNPCA